MMICWGISFRSSVSESSFMKHISSPIKIICFVVASCILICLLGFVLSNSKQQTRLQKITDFEIYYGEVNSVFSYVQIDTNFILNTTEFIFIDKDDNGYCNIDTSSISKADSLIPFKLEQINSIKNFTKNFQKIKKIAIDSNSFYIKLLESKSGTVLYNLERNKQQYFFQKEFAMYNKDTLSVQWTGRDNRQTKTRSFKHYKP